jgi:hypothetical protein
MSAWLGKKLSRFNMTGPYTPAVDKIADEYIRKIRICLAKDRQLTVNKESIKNIISDFEKTNKYDGHIIIDVDPV